MPIVDASVWVSLYHQRDRHHRRSVEWLEGALGAAAPIASPSLLAPEVAAAIRRLSGDEGLARGVLDEIERSGIVELVPLTLERSSRAAEIAAASAVRGADAVYLELARDRNDVLVTLDRQQLERGRQVARVQRP